MLEDIVLKMETELVTPYREAGFARLLISEQESAQKHGDTVSASYALAEAGALKIVPQDGILWPQFIPAGISDEEANAQVVAHFDDNSLDYFERRLTETNNPILRSRYAYILWSGKRKHQKFARSAIDSYLAATEVAIQQDLTNQPDGQRNSFAALPIGSFMRNAFYVARQSGIDCHEVVLKIEGLVTRWPGAGDSRISVQQSLIKLMMKERKVFRDVDWASVITACAETAKELVEKQHWQAAVEFLEFGLGIDTYKHTSSANWNHLIGETWEKAAGAAGDNLLGRDFLHRSIDAYTRSRNTRKVEELTQRSAAMRREIKVTGTQHEVDLSGYVQWCDAIVKKLKSESLKTILTCLCLSPEILPVVSQVRKVAEDLKKRSAFWMLVHTEVMDERGNTAKAVNSEDYDDFNFWQTYRLTMTYEKGILIDMILNEVVGSEKLKASDVMTELADFSWVFEPITHSLPDGTDITYTWADYLKPLLETYIEARTATEDNARFKLMMMFIDSATLKIEGMLRDMAEIMGLPSFMQVRDHSGTLVQRERDIDNLLREPRLLELLGDDVATYLRFLLVEQAGLKVRHKIAHALMFPVEYNRATADAVFLALIRVSNHTTDELRTRNAEGHNGA